MAKSPHSQPLAASEEPLRGSAIKARDPSQPRLPLDPMPDRIEPCLALAKERLPIGDEWAYEIKWDGYRICVHLENGRVRILTRGGHDWTARFPAIVDGVSRLGVGSAILDGEAVVLDDLGRPDFGKLQQSLGGRLGKASSDVAIMMAFDLLYFDGHDIRGVERSARRYFLQALLEDAEVSVRLSEEIDGDATEIFEAAREHGLEGIVAKRRDSTYTSGRTRDWIKVKTTQSDSFMIVGYEPSGSAKAGIGSLALAAYKGDAFVYVGSVGTGFSEADSVYLRRTLDRLKQKRPSIDYRGRGKDLVWVEPALIAEIEYRAWTHEGKLRAASYKGLRDVQDNAAIFRIES